MIQNFNPPKNMKKLFVLGEISKVMEEDLSFKDTLKEISKIVEVELNAQKKEKKTKKFKH